MAWFHPPLLSYGHGHVWVSEDEVSVPGSARSMPCFVPPGPLCPKGRAEPTAWPRAGASIRFGKGTPQLGHAPEAVGTIPVEMWGFGKVFSWQKVGVVGGQRFRGEPLGGKGVLSFRQGFMQTYTVSNDTRITLCWY